MTHRYAVLVVLVALAMVVAPTSVAQETATPTGEAVDTATPAQNGTDGAGLGTQLTAFTQSSSAAANDSIENGMWQAGFDQANSSDRDELVRDRTGSLARRLERLQAQNESLRERYENDNISEQAYVARQSQLSARIESLQTAVNDTDEAARQAGVNDSRLQTLQRNANRLRGPETADIARGLSGGPPENPGAGRSTGPPRDTAPVTQGDSGPPENQTEQLDGTDAPDGVDAGAGDGRDGAADSSGSAGGGGDPP